MPFVSNPIPEKYDLRKIVEALIKELEDEGALDSGKTRVRNRENQTHQNINIVMN
jgi:hypothetical protein